MATLSNDARTNMCNGLIDTIDAAASAAVLEIQNSSNDTLVEITLNDPSYGAPTNGVSTLNVSGLSGSPALGGTADHALVKDGDSNSVMSALTVGTSGANVNLDSLTIQVGVDVEPTSGTLTVPAS